MDCVYSRGTLVVLLSTVSPQCECVLAWLPGWPCLEPAVPVVKTHWCTNDAWVKRVSSKKTMCGAWSSLFSLPVKELEFKPDRQYRSRNREGVYKSGSTGI